MAEGQERGQQVAASEPLATKSEGETRGGDPGRTPGKAEGDEEPTDESAEQKVNG